MQPGDDVTQPGEDADDLGIFDGPPPVPGDDVEPAPPVTHADPAPAHPVVRVFAFLLDGLGTVIVTVAVVFAGIFNEASAFLAGILWVPVLSAVLATVLTAVFGVTAGKALVGIRVVHARTGGRPGFWAVPRSLVIVAPLLITIATATVLAEIPQDSGYSRLLDSLFLPLLFLPAVLWLVLLLVLAVRPRHRGLQDLAGNSVVVQRTGVPRTVARDSGR